MTARPLAAAQTLKASAALMLAFAERTGLTSAAPQRRYLWTDAFAVCNLLGLARATGEGRYQELALRLVDQVHRVLGRHRPEGPRTGWLSGLAETDAEDHPTRGGLRIGKPLPERSPDAPFDEESEWDRDGQYFHYLTKWMHALDQVARATRQPRFNVWARELAATAHGAFSHGHPGSRRLVWKMSCDLSRPLVSSMGQHDALEGLAVCTQLRATAAELGCAATGPTLAEPLADFAAMLATAELSTVDPLGLGGLLADAGRLEQLADRGAFTNVPLIDDLYEAALAGLLRYARRGDLAAPADRRLAFRELGLAIGLHALDPAPRSSKSRGDGTRQMLARAVARYRPHGEAIELFWLDDAHQGSWRWSEHRDIDEVMLATSLAPGGYLSLTPVDPPS